MLRSIIVILGFTFITSASWATVSLKITGNWSYIKSTIQQQEATSTLLIYDIDKTLLHFVEDCEAKGFIAQLYGCDVVATEKSVPKTVRQIQNKNYDTFALTARPPRMKKKTQEQLQELGYDFKDSSPRALPEQAAFSAEDFPGYGLSEKQAPIIEDGVYFSGSTKKGNSLNMLINEFSLNYKNIVFVDDGAQNVRSLIKTFKDRNDVHVIIVYYHRYHDKAKKEKDLKSIKKTLAK